VTAAAAPAGFPVAAPVTDLAPVTEADFAALVADVAHAIEHTMPVWRVRLGEAAARWRAEGVRTAVLERALALPRDPGAEALIATFADAVSRLRELERDAAAADPSLAGAPCFRDPERLREAAGVVARARAEGPPGARRLPAPVGAARRRAVGARVAHGRRAARRGRRVNACALGTPQAGRR
jgi:hypothetical protein